MKNYLLFLSLGLVACALPLRGMKLSDRVNYDNTAPSRHSDDTIPEQNPADEADQPDEILIPLDAVQQAELNTALYKAVKKNDCTSIRRLRAQGAQFTFERKKKLVFLLLLAVEKGHTEAVRALLELQVPLYKKNKSSQRNALMLAAEKGHREILTALLAAGFDPNRRGANKSTALMYAVQQGDVENCRSLLDRGAHVNTQTEYGWTPLLYAAAQGSPEIIRLLLSEGADIDHVTENNITALMIAAQYGHKEAFQILIERGADQTKTNKAGKTAHMLAKGDAAAYLTRQRQKPNDTPRKQAKRACAESSQPRIEREPSHEIEVQLSDRSDGTEKITSETDSDDKVLLTNTSDLQVYKRRKSVSEASPDEALFIALTNKDLDALKLALRRGARVNSSRSFERNPLFWAVDDRFPAGVALLLERGAKPDVWFKDRSPLMLAAENGDTAIVTSLLTHSANVNTASKKTKATALSLAVTENHQDIVELLLNRDADANVKLQFEWTSLMIAADHGHLDIARLLLAKKAAVDQQNRFGATALLIAAEKGHTKIVELLLKHHASVNLANGSQTTPLMFACAENHLDMVDVLLENRAQIDAQSNAGWTALMFAALNGHQECVRKLVNAGARQDLTNADGRTAYDVVAGHVQEIFTLQPEQKEEILPAILDVDAASLLVQLGQTAVPQTPTLHDVVRSNNLNGARELLQQGAAIDARDAENRTPLMVAADLSYSALVGLLLERGADITLRDSHNRTFIEYLKDENLRALVRCLIARARVQI